MSTLVVVPCGRKKVWDKEPGRGATEAQDVYIGIAFRRNREYAERFSDQWMILSAKYGLVRPDFVIPGPYDVTFNDRATGPVTAAALREQVVEHHLNSLVRVVALGGKAYRTYVEEAFAGIGAHIVAPFSGLPIGKYLQAVRRAVETGDGRIDRVVSEVAVLDSVRGVG